MIIRIRFWFRLGLIQDEMRRLIYKGEMAMGVGLLWAWFGPRKKNKKNEDA